MTDFDFRRMLDAVPDAVLACDGAGRIAHANAAVVALLGWSLAELVGRPVDAVVPGWAPGPDNAATPAHASARRADGTVIELELSARPGGDPGGPAAWVIVLRPAAERSAAERTIQATARMAAKLGTRLELDALLATAVEALVADFDAALGQLWLHDAEADALALRAVAKPSGSTEPSAPERLDLRTGGGPVVAVARTRQPLVRDDLAGDPHFDADWLHRERVGAVAAFPLLAAGRLRGVLVHFGRRPPAADLVEALETFAAVAAAALNDVELFAREQAARVEAEDQRRKLRAVLDTISVGVLLAEGPAGRLALVNGAAEEIFGGPIEADTIEQFIERFPLVAPDGRVRPIEERPFWRTLRRGERVRDVLRYRRPDGREVVLDIHSAPFPGGGAVSTFRDITDRVRLESEQAERAAQFKALLDHLPVGVAYFDSRGICRACNGPARQFLGRSRREIVGAGADELFAQSEGLRDALIRCVRDQTPHVELAAPWPARSGDDLTRFLDWRFNPLPAEPGRPRGALALLVDVTERTLTQVELQRAKLAAEQASRNKTQFLSAVSHDLRTPVNALSLQAELLSRIVAGRVGEDHDDLVMLAGDIQKAAANLIELINDLLDLTRFDSGQVEHHPTDFALDEWLDSTLAPLEVMARGKGLEFSWAVDRPGRILRADRVKLGRVLVNLTGNAVKFTEQGAVAVRVGADADGWLAVSVVDTGPGIPADQIDRIFDEFAQLRNPERDRTKGTGLGLAICRRLVEAVGGRLTVRSRQGVGSTFTALYPPDHLTPAGPPPSHVDDADLPSRANSAAPILLVEDDPHSRSALTRLLAHAGYTVEPAADGLAALEVLDRIRPSLVLLDMMMPGMDGAEVLDRIRRRPDGADLPVIILTGDVMGGRTGELRALDVDGMLAKPVEFDELLRIVSRHAIAQPTPS